MPKAASRVSTLSFSTGRQRNDASSPTNVTLRGRRTRQRYSRAATSSVSIPDSDHDSGSRVTSAPIQAILRPRTRPRNTASPNAHAQNASSNPLVTAPVRVIRTYASRRTHRSPSIISISDSGDDSASGILADSNQMLLTRSLTPNALLTGSSSQTEARVTKSFGQWDQTDEWDDRDRKAVVYFPDSPVLDLHMTTGPSCTIGDYTAHKMTLDTPSGQTSGAILDCPESVIIHTMLASFKAQDVLVRFKEKANTLRVRLPVSVEILDLFICRAISVNKVPVDSLTEYLCLDPCPSELALRTQRFSESPWTYRGLLDEHSSVLRAFCHFAYLDADNDCIFTRILHTVEPGQCNILLLDADSSEAGKEEFNNVHECSTMCQQLGFRNPSEI
ncbi:hypothetical protein VNI00_014521 [Paramarasmius palmivorus]|uniref:Alpha-type protein kinase domain-containing protein n=1 Tax=Paramarasmius palmivorus TaxID=297713 RepID=A0AAW0BT71_9AGAR